MLGSHNLLRHWSVQAQCSRSAPGHNMDILRSVEKASARTVRGGAGRLAELVAEVQQVRAEEGMVQVKDLQQHRVNQFRNTLGSVCQKIWVQPDRG